MKSNHPPHRRLPHRLLASLLLSGGSLAAQTTPAARPDTAPRPEAVTTMEKFVLAEKVDDPAGIMPNTPADSVFGLGLKSIDTPRSISVVTAEMIELFDIDDINDLVALTSGTYTSSFFGVPGALDIRGAPGETFFRGMKRIKNPGNFPTPIGASDRIDVVKGPPSPIFGPGPIGGYLNFIPKSARASTGRYLGKPTGKIATTFGSFEKRVSTAEVGGPAPIFGKTGGYYAYVLTENSGSFYQNSYQDQLIIQSSFDYDLTPSVRIQFGEQYHYYGGTENAGWNRISQDLIDNRNYITGSPPSIDTDGDGLNSRAEYLAAGVNVLNFAIANKPYGNTNPAAPNANYRLLNPGTAKLERNQVLIAAGDKVDSKSFGAFFDVIKTFSPTVTLTNKVFVDYLDRYKYAAYGFSQQQEAFTFENKLVADTVHTPSDALKITTTTAGSFYFNHANGRSDTSSETFERRDITKPSTAIDRAAHAYLRPDLKPWDNDITSKYTDLSLGLVTAVSYRERTHLLLGARLDYIPKMTSKQNGINAPLVRPAPLPGRNQFARGEVVENDDSGTSWNVSLSHNLIVKSGNLDVLSVYGTRAHQSLISSGQDGEVAPGVVMSGPLNGTELKELGLKASFFGGKLFASVAGYSQTRSGVSDGSVDLTVTATKGEGIETEIRYVPLKQLAFTVAANWQKTVYDPPLVLQPSGLLGVNAGTQWGNPATTGVPGINAYGGTVFTAVPAARAATDFIERAGSPDKVISGSVSYTMMDRLTATLSGTYQASVSADRLKSVILPSAMVFNGSLGYGIGAWHLKVSVSNITDEWYYRSNFPDIFGGAVVLPLPSRGYEFSASFKF